MSDDKQKPERPPEIDFPDLNVSMENDQGQTVSLFDSVEIRDSRNLTILNESKQKND